MIYRVNMDRLASQQNMWNENWLDGLAFRAEIFRKIPLTPGYSLCILFLIGKTQLAHRKIPNKNHKIVRCSSLKTEEFAPNEEESHILRILRALANPARLWLTALLAERKDCTFAQLAEALPLAQSSLSDHLTTLREAGLVEVSSDTPQRYYGVNPKTIDELTMYMRSLAQQARSWKDLVRAAEKERTLEIRPAIQA